MADIVYQPGDSVPLQATFKNAAGALTNTTVTLTVRAPDGSTTTPTPTNTSTGVYEYDYLVAANAPTGVWEYIYAGTGNVTAAQRKTFVVEAASLLARIDPAALVSLADVRSFVYRDVTDNAQDAELVERINEYSRAVTKYTGREWMPQTSAATRTFTYNGGGYLGFMPGEARAVTSVTMFADQPTVSQLVLVAPGGTVEGQWRLSPAGKTPEQTYLGLELPMLGRTPRYLDGDPWYGAGWAYPSAYFRGTTMVTVTGDWGIATSLAGVPSDVQLAVKVAIKDAYVNPAGLATASIGPNTYTEEPLITSSTGDAYASNLPYEARALLDPYRREQRFVFA